YRSRRNTEMRINTNISAINAYGNLSKVQDMLSSSMQKLSSGFRINKAGDDAAGLGIANQLRGDIGAMQQAANNADQASSVLQIMDGATQNIQSILERMKELAAQSASDTVDDSARTKINNEFQSLSGELDRIVDTTKFEGANLLDGTFGSKSVANGAVDAGSSLLTAHVGGVTVTDSSKLAGLSGDITASVAKKDNKLAANFNSGVALTVTSQSTVDSLDASDALSVAVTQNAATASIDTSGEGSASSTTMSVSTITSGAKSLKAGSWTITTAANGSDEDITFTNDADNSQTSTVTVSAGATSMDFGGITIDLGGTVDQANLAKLSGAKVTVTQNYSVAVSGGNVSGGQTAAVADNGTTQTAAFSNYGFSFGVATGTAGTFDGKSIGLTEEDQLQLTSGSTSQAIDLNSNPASQSLNFTKFGVTVALSGSATVANLTSDFAANKNTIQRTTSHQAQFLVSASQNYTGNDLINLAAINLSASQLGVDTTSIDLTSASGAQAALTSIDGAITSVGTALGSIGAAENRIGYASSNVKTAIENFTAAESTIRDVDMAQEMTNFSKEQILSQAGTAMLAQANQLGSSVLKLLQ
ncbi:MAG TPA: flagellin, partial [Gemmatimonadaceae bacterium]|nr:flagellin [Gemmatimonadaceae bacterium]